MVALPRARARALKAGVPTGTVRTSPTAHRLARPPRHLGSEAVRPSSLSEASLSVRHPDSRRSRAELPSRCLSVGSPPFLPPRQHQSEATTAISPSVLRAAGEVPCCLLLHAAFRHPATPTSFCRPHPFRSPRRTLLAAALLRRLHPELGSAALLALVRFLPCSLSAPLAHTTVRATLLSPPRNVASPRRHARAGA
jgi:hypothetical protein